MTRTSIFYLQVALLATPFTHAVEIPEGPPELTQAVEIYTKQLRNAHAPTSNAQIGLRWQYLQALRLMEKKAKAAGELKAIESITREFKRFASSKTFEKDKRNSLPPAVQAEFDRFKVADDQMLNHWSNTRKRLDMGFTNKLSEMQKMLTIENRIEDAVKVKEFIPEIPDIRIAKRSRPGLARGKNTRSFNSPTDLEKHILRTRWELIWAGGNDEVPQRPEHLEFHYGNVITFESDEGKLDKYIYEIGEDFNVRITSSKSKHIGFDPSYTLLDFNDEKYRHYHRGRLISPIENTGSENMLQDIVVYYPLDEVSPLARDAGPAGNHAAATDVSVVYFGKRKNAWQFNGHTSQLVVGNPIDINAMQQFTIACWFRIHRLNNRNKLMHWEEAADNSGTYIEVSEKALNFKTGTGGKHSNRYSYAYESKFELNTWYHVAMTYDVRGGTLLFLNGKLVQTQRALPLGDNATTFYIGGNEYPERRNSDTFINGWLDEVFVFKRALSPDEVKTLYEFAQK